MGKEKNQFDYNWMYTFYILNYILDYPPVVFRKVSYLVRSIVVSDWRIMLWE